MKWDVMIAVLLLKWPNEEIKSKGITKAGRTNVMILYSVL